MLADVEDTLERTRLELTHVKEENKRLRHYFNRAVTLYVCICRTLLYVVRTNDSDTISIATLHFTYACLTLSCANERLRHYFNHAEILRAQRVSLLLLVICIAYCYACTHRLVICVADIYACMYTVRSHMYR